MKAVVASNCGIFHRIDSAFFCIKLYKRTNLLVRNTRRLGSDPIIGTADVSSRLDNRCGKMHHFLVQPAAIIQNDGLTDAVSFDRQTEKPASVENNFCME